ncbi:MAG: hypothetical protein AB8C02_15245 [Halioglobus sp.]
MPFKNLLKPQQRLLAQEKELVALRKELETLKAQNASMRDGMRRCVTCEYRIDFKQRQDAQAP